MTSLCIRTHAHEFYRCTEKLPFSRYNVKRTVKRTVKRIVKRKFFSQSFILNNNIISVIKYGGNYNGKI